MAEWSERWSRNPAVLGSIPALATEIVFVWVSDLVNMQFLGHALYIVNWFVSWPVGILNCVRCPPLADPSARIYRHVNSGAPRGPKARASGAP